MAPKILSLLLLTVLCQILVTLANANLLLLSEEIEARHVLRCPRRLYEVCRPELWFPAWNPSRYKERGNNTYLVGSKAYHDIVPGVSAYWKDMRSVNELCHKLHEEEEEQVECLKFGSKLAFNKSKSSFIALQDVHWKIFVAIYKVLESCLF